MICENYWFRMEVPDGLSLEEVNIDEVMHKLACTKEAVTEIFDEYHQKVIKVCEECSRQIELSNWLRTPEGQAAIWADDEEN